ncbi:MAG: histidine--tRNA ligase [Gammaproteobacteria bacterium]
MAAVIQPIRGMNDILPAATPTWQWVESVARDVFMAYGYSELRVPIVERTELFSRSIGEVTDIVEKEMYSFQDRNGDQLSLRPEATASCVRAAISNSLIHNQQQRLWYAGPMFRYERPQKGRYRQFHQLGAEALGFTGPDVDAELILMSARLWRSLGLDGLRLELNSLGTSASRAIYRDLLVEYFHDHRAALDADSLRRLAQNPLRILDSKNPELASLIAAAPSITDHLDAESAEHFGQLQAALDAAGVTYRVNPRLVRGLDYYSRTVFEWLTDRLGAQAAVCSGGRYDGLVEQLGGRATPAIGWALGMERLVELVQENAPAVPLPHAYLVGLGDSAQVAMLALAESLRDGVAGLRVLTHCGGGSLKAAMKKADKSGAALALILGDAELAAGRVLVKPLRSRDEQQAMEQDALRARLIECVAAERS